MDFCGLSGLRLVPIFWLNHQRVLQTNEGLSIICPYFHSKLWVSHDISNIFPLQSHMFIDFPWQSLSFPWVCHHIPIIIHQNPIYFHTFSTAKLWVSQISRFPVVATGFSQRWRTTPAAASSASAGTGRATARCWRSSTSAAPLEKAVDVRGKKQLENPLWLNGWLNGGYMMDGFGGWMVVVSWLWMIPLCDRPPIIPSIILRWWITNALWQRDRSTSWDSWTSF